MQISAITIQGKNPEQMGFKNEQPAYNPLQICYAVWESNLLKHHLFVLYFVAEL